MDANHDSPSSISPPSSSTTGSSIASSQIKASAETQSSSIKTTTKDYPSDDSNLPISRADDYLVSTVCLFSGILAMFAFYQMTLSFVALDSVWPGQVFTDLLGGTQWTAALSTSLFMLSHNGIQVKFFYIASALYFMVGIAFPLVVTLLPGMDNFYLARGLLIVVSAVTGLADGLISVVGYGLASILPRNRVPLRSAGCSLAGLIPWIVFQILSLCFKEDERSQKSLMWFFMPCGVFISIPMVVCVAILQRRAWWKHLMRVANELHEAKYTPRQNGCCKSSPVDLSPSLFSCSSFEQGSAKEKSAKVLQPPTTARSPKVVASYRTVFKKSGLYLGCSSLLFLVFGLLFPIIAPYRFQQSNNWTTGLNGVGQVSQTVMRFAAVYAPFVRIRPNWLFPVIVIRSLIFFPLFISISRISPLVPVLHNPWFLSFCMVLFSGFHGWAVVLSYRYVQDCLRNENEKALASKLMAITAFTSMGTALFASKLLVL